MINPVIGEFQQQPPVSRALQPTQAPQNPADNNPQVTRAPQGSQTQDAQVTSGRTEEINSSVALSRDTSRINPSQIFNDSQERGSILDITA